MVCNSLAKILQCCGGWLLHKPGLHGILSWGGKLEHGFKAIVKGEGAGGGCTPFCMECVKPRKTSNLHSS